MQKRNEARNVKPEEEQRLPRMQRMQKLQKMRRLHEFTTVERLQKCKY